MFDFENSEAGDAAGKTRGQSHAGIWFRIAAILGLITASVFFVMVCTCDFPWQTPKALLLLASSLAACLAAAWVLFRIAQFLPNSAPILRAVAAVAVAIAVRLVELKLAIHCVAWLAERSR
jgi:hypothetical protein